MRASTSRKRSAISDSGSCVLPMTETIGSDASIEQEPKVPLEDAIPIS
jgi:hypothetical protein